MILQFFAYKGLDCGFPSDRDNMFYSYYLIIIATPVQYG